MTLLQAPNVDHLSLCDPHEELLNTFNENKKNQAINSNIMD